MGIPTIYRSDCENFNHHHHYYHCHRDIVYRTQHQLTFWSAASHSTMSAEICPDTMFFLLLVLLFTWKRSLPPSRQDLDLKYSTFSSFSSQLLIIPTHTLPTKSQTSSSVLDFLLTSGPGKQIHTHWMTIQRQLMRVPKSLPWTKESLLLCKVDASI